MARRSASSGVVWQVLAPWVRWPLHSPRRLAAVLVLVVGLLLCLSWVNGRTSARGAGSSAAVSEASAAVVGAPAAAVSAAPSASVATSVSTSASTSVATEGVPGATLAAPPPTTSADDADEPPAAGDRYLAVARDFLAVYLAAPHTAPADWQAKVKPLVSTALYPGMAAVDPARVPTGTVAGLAAVSTSSDGGGVARANLTTGEALDVTVGTDPGGALVVVALEPHT